MRRHYLPYVPTPRGRPPMRWTDTQEPVSCRKCNEHWEAGDPALTIACMGCKAGLSRTSQPRKAQAGRASRGLARLAGP
ncbi:hypothetical protein AD933_00545 [Acetobacter malorum]|uniref:Uncharacterized protein n=1 Tax=Acetobacter malorum TaxID=178901 RepID=A0A149S6F4_9PROT|nr:hypothetical protein [Acetobacter malorum]KXV22314.1 hypothetical protein AD933_00545 [Acetobacter malorum]